MGKKSHKPTCSTRMTEIRYIDAAIKKQARDCYRIVYLSKDEQERAKAMQELHRIKQDNDCMYVNLGFEKYEIELINNFRFPAIVEVDDTPYFVLSKKPKVGKLAPFVRIHTSFKVSHKPWGSNIKYIFPDHNYTT